MTLAVVLVSMVVALALLVVVGVAVQYMEGSLFP